MKLSPGEHIVFTPQLSDGWLAALTSERGDTSLDSLRRKLKSISTGNASALIVQVVKGSGEINLISSEIPIEPITYPDPQMEIPDFPPYQESKNIVVEGDSLIDQTDEVYPSTVEADLNLYQDQAPDLSESLGISDDHISEVEPIPSKSRTRRPSRFMDLIKGSGSTTRKSRFMPR